MLAHNTNPIADMSPRVLKIFVFIEKQLMCQTHPLNVIQNNFITDFVNYYTSKLSEVPRFSKKKINSVLRRSHTFQKSLQQSQMSIKD